MPIGRSPRRFVRQTAVIATAVAVCIGGCSGSASAELVTFSTGRTMSVKAHREEGPSLVFTLRAGGEMAVDATLVTSIAPDEVPWPEPVEAVLRAETPKFPNISPPVLAVDARFDPIIRRMAAEKGVDASLVRAVIQVESGYEPRARSGKGAVGLMQVMPATGRRYGITNLYDPSANIRAGVTHLKTLLDRFPLALALAAYNAGEAAVERFSGVPPYPETVDYVSKVRALAGR
jgi:Transglycosylase SLT domain